MTNRSPEANEGGSPKKDKIKWFGRALPVLCLVSAGLLGVEIVRTPASSHQTDGQITGVSSRENYTSNNSNLEQVYVAMGAVILGIAGTLGLALPLAPRHPDRRAAQINVPEDKPQSHAAD